MQFLPSAWSLPSRPRARTYVLYVVVTHRPVPRSCLEVNVLVHAHYRKRDRGAAHPPLLSTCACACVRVVSLLHLPGNNPRFKHQVPQTKCCGAIRDALNYLQLARVSKALSFFFFFFSRSGISSTYPACRRSSTGDATGHAGMSYTVPI